MDNKSKGYSNKSNSYEYRAESNSKKPDNKKEKYKSILVAELIILLLAVVGILTFAVLKGGFFKKNSGKNGNNNQTQGGNNVPGGIPEGEEEGLTPEEKEEKRIEEEKKAQQEKITKLVEEADLLAIGYDYDKAIETIKSYGQGYTNHKVLTDAIAKYEEAKGKLVPLGAYESVGEISHIFFHSLVADNSKAFDGDYESNGYNYYMTTISEFKEMMKQMYEAGYVLVSIHDVAHQVKAEDGTTKFVPGDIMLPPDKKPFVLSQDDVNYYEYMKEDGFASKAVIDENGRPSTAMIMDDGTVSVGDYDMVPVLETFIAEHPDFSYKGARGLLALTGYEGTLGYRTNDKTSPTYEQDKEAVKEVIKVMKEWGWEFGSHSYGHRNMGKVSYTFTVQDSDRWMEEVGSLVGPTDVYVFPYGIDIEENIGAYTSDKYNYLKSLGFNYYCGVFKEPWIQVKDEYVRMTRRPLDGQAMLQFPERLADLFDLSKVIDPDRPELK